MMEMKSEEDVASCGLSGFSSSFSSDKHMTCVNIPEMNAVTRRRRRAVDSFRFDAQPVQTVL